jgi:hypothetical protein
MGNLALVFSIPLMSSHYIVSPASAARLETKSRPWQAKKDSETQSIGRGGKKPFDRLMAPSEVEGPFDRLMAPSEVEGPFDRLKAPSEVEGPVDWLTAPSAAEGPREYY